MMITRVAGLLILLSQLLLLGVIWDTTGAKAIWFSFVGHPLLGAGLALAVLSIVRRMRASNGAAGEESG